MGMEVHFESHVKEVMAKIHSTAEKRMMEAVDEVRNATLETLSGSRTGRVYRVPGTRREYTASAPGEPPAVQMADLRNSVKGGFEKDGDAVVGFIGTELPKGPMLEYGTVKMEARPWLRTSFEKSADTVQAIFKRVWIR